jgi:FixJ family two-component response regulator
MSHIEAQDPMVLVLDDEPAVCDSLRELLESEHYQVRTFDSPKQFL